jgi:hypothetical protein
MQTNSMKITYWQKVIVHLIIQTVHEKMKMKGFPFLKYEWEIR